MTNTLVSEIARIVSRSTIIIAEFLSPTSARSSSTLAFPMPLKSCSRHPHVLVRGLGFCMKPIGGCSIHHQFVPHAVSLIMPYQSTEVVEHLLWCLYKLL